MNQYYFRKLFHSILGWSQACIREWIVLKILMDGLNRYDVMFPWIPLHKDHCTVVEWNTFWNSSLIFRLLCCHDSCIQFICTMCNIKKISGIIKVSLKLNIFWKRNKTLRKSPWKFDVFYSKFKLTGRFRQIEDCGLLRIYELKPLKKWFHPIALKYCARALFTEDKRCPFYSWHQKCGVRKNERLAWNVCGIFMDPLILGTEAAEGLTIWGA